MSLISTVIPIQLYKNEKNVYTKRHTMERTGDKNNNNKYYRIGERNASNWAHPLKMRWARMCENVRDFLSFFARYAEMFWIWRTEMRREREHNSDNCLHEFKLHLFCGIINSKRFFHSIFDHWIQRWSQMERFGGRLLQCVHCSVNINKFQIRRRFRTQWNECNGQYRAGAMSQLAPNEEFGILFSTFERMN